MPASGLSTANPLSSKQPASMLRDSLLQGDSGYISGGGAPELAGGGGTMGFVEDDIVDL